MLNGIPSFHALAWYLLSSCDNHIVSRLCQVSPENRITLIDSSSSTSLMFRGYEWSVYRFGWEKKQFIPGRLQSMGSHTVRYDLSDFACTHVSFLGVPLAKSCQDCLLDFSSDMSLHSVPSPPRLKYLINIISYKSKHPNCWYQPKSSFKQPQYFRGDQEREKTRYLASPVLDSLCFWISVDLR